MEMNGSHLITASRETVWAALNDPEVLKACIPGLQGTRKTVRHGNECDGCCKSGAGKGHV